MKYLLLDQKGVILYISSTIGYQSNGNVEVDRGTLVYAAILVDRVIEVASIPDDVESEKWCYKDDKFVLNLDWREPVPEGDTNATIDALLTEMEAILNAG